MILDRRKETVRSLREKRGGVATSSPTRPKSSPYRPNNIDHPSFHQRASNVGGPAVTGKRGLQEEVDERQEDSEGSSGPLPKLVLGQDVDVGTVDKGGDDDS